MFDKDFDPLTDLTILKYQVTELQTTAIEQVETFREVSKAIHRIVEKINEVIAKVDAQDVAIIELNNRLRLLEAVRIYETRQER